MPCAGVLLVHLRLDDTRYVVVMLQLAFVKGRNVLRGEGVAGENGTGRGDGGQGGVCMGGGGQGCRCREDQGWVREVNEGVITGFKGEWR